MTERERERATIRALMDVRNYAKADRPRRKEMPQQYDDTNRGVMFANRRKEPGSKQPDFTGSINVEGREYDVSCWLRMSKKGNEFYSMSIKPKPQSDDADIPFGR